MYDDELPEFRSVPRNQVMSYLNGIFNVPGMSGSALLKLIEYDDHHFRAIFKSTFFALQPGAEAPTKSQWGTLKKKMKRHDRQVFVFKQTGEVNCNTVDRLRPENRDYRCYYVDFGYFLD